MELNELKFDAHGLIPAVVQDFRTRQVLTLAYMNRESLEITLREKRTCFYSRSRQTLWRKGETSGNVQHVVRISADCDGDACFFRLLYGDAAEAPFTLDGLYRLLLSRKTERPAGSYTTYLFDKGREKILKKVGEECTEVVIGAMKGSREETIFEVSDLAYHVLVLMAEMGITPEDIRAELASRHVIDHKVKQETMQ